MTNPFPDHPPTAPEHFRLLFYAAVTRAIERALPSFPSPEAAFERLPFLAAYHAELGDEVRHRLASGGAGEWWRRAIAAWEETIPGHLPLRALREAAGLDHTALLVLLAVGLVEEDARFGLLPELLLGLPGQRRLTYGLLSGWWCGPGEEPREPLRRLQELGLVQVANPDAPRAEWALQVAAAPWDVVRGERPDWPSPGLCHRPADGLGEADALIVPGPIRRALDRLPGLLAAGEAQAVIVRGPRRNGRRTLLGAVARALGRGVVELPRPSVPGSTAWTLAGTLATLLHAMPVVALDPAPGDVVELPRLAGSDAPLGVALGRQGGVTGPDVERAVTLVIDLPHADARRLHWSAALDGRPVAGLDAIADRFRLTSGNIRRAARIAPAYAALDGREVINSSDVQRAARDLNRQALDTLATRLDAVGDWDDLAVGDDARQELLDLEARCRQRERLCLAAGHSPGGPPNCGVRALFGGPSGTGKTLAARVLAAALGMDLYRLDLSSVVNKYIGETEKNLNQLFAHAEELDVLLLLDEGDALLTQRTNVQSSNDRYANLETNYLLQRLETFEGILLVTTNAGDRIDPAFRRRMDVVIEFRPPEPAERLAIWARHLPPGHAAPAGLLNEVAARCTLSGGQIRNAVLHATQRALDRDAPLDAADLEAAVRREYRKLGAICPLRQAPGPFGSNGHPRF